MDYLDRKFSCFLIGRVSFVFPCARYLLASGHHILGMITTDKSLAQSLTVGDDWADLDIIPQVEIATNLLDVLKQQPFDYLFSISNSIILSEDILRLPRLGTINCHDGPLPKYGGMNAPTWAIIDRAKTHGITWHQVTSQIDGGDILKQVSFEIEASETGATINSKCYELIIASFPELVDELAHGKISPIAQNLQERSYFYLSQKPSPGCILNWQQSARKIDAIIRALNYGNYENLLGLPKLAIANEIFVVDRSEILDRPSQLPPGTIVEMETDRLSVATGSHDLLISNLQTLDGKSVIVSELVDRLGENSRGSSSEDCHPKFIDLNAEVAQKISDLERKLVKHESFWVERLATLNPLITSLPWKSNGATPATGSSDKSPIFLRDWSISPAIVEFAAKYRPILNLGDFLVAAIATYLSKTSHQNCFDLAFKYSELDRELADLSKLFVDRIPVRFDLDLDRSFLANLATIDRELTLVKQHQTYARDLVLRYPKLRDFTKLSVADRLPISIERFTNNEYLSKLRSGAIPQGLTFAISEDGTNCYCYGDPELVDECQIDSLLEQSNAFFSSIIDNPDLPIAKLPLLSPLTADIQVQEWNDTQTDFRTAGCIHELFEAQVARTPEAIALIWERERVTYRELNDRSNRLARYLRTLGVAPDVLVGICLERSIDSIVGILGILKAGGAYVPLDPTYPPERLVPIVADTAMPIIVSESGSIAKLPGSQARVVCIDLEREQIGALPHAPNMTTEVRANHLAYVIYTSGSTGKPKGVAIEHHSLVNYTIAAAREFDLTQHDRVLQFTSLNCDVSAEEIYTCLTVGATLVMRDEATISSLDAFFSQCQQCQISVTSLPTAYWHELTARLDLETLTLPTSWRLAIIGGEKVVPARFQEWQKSVGSRVRLINAYGPTEATISALMCDLSKLDPDRLLTEAPIGKPIANMKAYVLDPDLALCPIGTPGELYLCGAGLARGYLNEPELTAQKFIPNPFDPLSTRLYRTGDLVKYLPDGNLQFLGRLDEQVKIRGFRVELGEIETVLNAHPDVREAIVLNRPVGSSQTGLAAYLVPKHQQQPEWWPSVGEYPVYDELLYESMTTDAPRNQAYSQALERVVKDKIVVEIGTGKDAILARFCIAAGATKVYAIEAGETAFQQAQQTIGQLGLEDKIIPIHGYSTAVRLPELVDVCVSEIIGNIGSSEGVAPILNDARRFLKANARTIPHRCTTKIAAITLPDRLRERPSFGQLTGHYTQQIFDLVGQPFDLRLCIKNLPPSNLISNSDIFEDLVFDTETAIETSQNISLTITKSARWDGLLLWLNLYTAPDLIIDNLDRVYTSWLPVYFPIFDPGLDVIPGDRIEATCRSRSSDNQINPDYQIEGKLIAKNGQIIPFCCDSLHHQQPKVRSPFYDRLFPNGQISIDSERDPLTAKNIRAYVARLLPEYMVPTRIVTIPALPLTPNGKVDRRALLSMTPDRVSTPSALTVNPNLTERILLEIWQEILGLEQIDPDDNFFELGGHSLLAIQLFTKIEQRLKVQLPLSVLVRSPTLAQLSERLTKLSQENISSSLLPIQPHGSKPPFFCVHSLDPGLLFYQPLVEHLGLEQPFYSIQPYDRHNQLLSFAKIEDIAAYYLWEVRSVQPQGPYYLGGFSFGGYIAFEMAQLLRKQGEEVALLAIFDTLAPGVSEKVSAVEQSIGVWKLARKYGWQFLYQKLLNQLTLYRRMSRDLLPNLLVHPTPSVSIPQQQQDRSIADDRVLAQYHPDVYPGKITLFQAGYAVNTIQLAQGWDKLAGAGVETIEIPGDHASIFSEAKASFLARELSRCIDNLLVERQS
ncbi:amino acid adenylation domain-containing protein [Chamaesiphon polymorphus]|uniref:Carrier domain-containing protein n=1 Tax=Chamaesiphon polymorphus CCALA 037 TaxID=2107692 RepID=A0A2T1GKI5_9CYAN|nr:amino acid adenylation domain-containing protein [Chamaesiphon polymorphus]PSB58350.1 hypothetical protein C7B77_05165 [Chamaesiphon polymorphus CCALA 037]